MNVVFGLLYRNTVSPINYGKVKTLLYVRAEARWSTQSQLGRPV